nr:peptidase C48, SUMO/sentrin/Ubl1 [Tanacetum cinerariifolium]
MRPFIPKLKWRTSNNHVDCGVFAMIHMENYVGDATKNYEFGLCKESDEQLSMLQRLRYKIATKIMLHQFNAVSNKMFDFAFTFETKNTEQARVSMIVDAIKNMNNRDPPKQVKETGAANVVVDCGVFAMIHMENYVGDATKNYEFGLCKESDEQLSMLQRLRYKIATKIMLHQFNAVSNKMFDFAFTFETKNTEQARVSMIVDAIKNMNNRDPPKQVKETGAANVVVGVNEVVD